MDGLDHKIPMCKRLEKRSVSSLEWFKCYFELTFIPIISNKHIFHRKWWKMILWTQEHIYFSFCHNGKIYQFFVSSWTQYRKASCRRKRIEEEKAKPQRCWCLQNSTTTLLYGGLYQLLEQSARSSLYRTLCRVGLLLSFVFEPFEKGLWLLILHCQYICCIKYYCSFRIQPPLTAWIVFNKLHWQLQPHTIMYQSSNTF